MLERLIRVASRLLYVSCFRAATVTLLRVAAYAMPADMRQPLLPAVLHARSVPC